MGLGSCFLPWTLDDCWIPSWWSRPSFPRFLQRQPIQGRCQHTGLQLAKSPTWWMGERFWGHHRFLKIGIGHRNKHVGHPPLPPQSQPRGLNHQRQLACCRYSESHGRCYNRKSCKFLRARHLRQWRNRCHRRHRWVPCPSRPYRLRSCYIPHRDHHALEILQESWQHPEKNQIQHNDQGASQAGRLC